MGGKDNDNVMPPIDRSGSIGAKLLSILLLAIAIAYVVMPIDYDGPIIGYLDDFMLFMSAFLNMMRTFYSNTIVRHKLGLISMVFLVVAGLWIVVLAMTPIMVWCA